MSTSQPPSSDRRRAERHLACFPAAVRRPDGAERTAMLRDLSVTGALLLIHTELAVGDHVVLELHLSEDLEQTRRATGRVVRVVPLAEDEIGMWLEKVAIEFDGALTIYAEEIAALNERLARLGLDE